MNRILPVLVSAFLLFSCNEQQDAGPYAGILQEEPYKVLTDSIEEDPKDADLYFRRAVMLNSRQQVMPALADFRKAWTLDPQEKYALGVGNIWLTAQPDSAVAFVERALNELPKSLFLKLLLARAYEANKQPAKAVEICDQIVAEDPQQVNAHILKAELLQGINQDSLAVPALEQAFALLPDNRALAEELAYAYAETKNPKTIALVDSLLEADTAGEFASPLYIKGNYYANRNMMAEAIRWYDETIRRDHRYLNAYIEKGKLYFNSGQTERALSNFQLANTIAPAFADAWFWIAKCQEKMGQKAEAKLNYQKAASLDPEFTEAKEAADKL